VRKILLTNDLNVKTGTLTDYVENDSANYVPLPDTELIPRIQSFSVQRHTIYSDHCSLTFSLRSFSETTCTKSFCKDEESVAIMFSALTHQMHSKNMKLKYNERTQVFEDHATSST